MSFELVLSGSVYDGWTEASATRSLETLSGAFRAALSDRGDAGAPPRGIGPDDPVSVRLDGETVLDGRVDAVSVEYDEESHSVTVEGRDAAADLVDCSVPTSPVEWRGATILEVAQELAAPFGVDVRADADVGAPFAPFRTEEGETVWEAISRGLAMRALLGVSDGAGAVVLTRPERRRSGVRLERGRNVLAGTATFDRRERYGSYTVLAQQPGDDFLGVAETAHVEGRASDPGARPERRLVLLAEQGASLMEATQRAEWEAGVRAARSRRAAVRVAGWREESGGALWSPGTLVSVRDAWLGIDGDLLVASVRQSVSDAGTTTDIELVPPHAYAARPEREPRDSEGEEWWF